MTFAGLCAPPTATGMDLFFVARATMIVSWGNKCYLLSSLKIAGRKVGYQKDARKASLTNMGRFWRAQRHGRLRLQQGKLSDIVVGRTEAAALCSAKTYTKELLMQNQEIITFIKDAANEADVILKETENDILSQVEAALKDNPDQKTIDAIYAWCGNAWLTAKAEHKTTKLKISRLALAFAEI